MNSSVAALEAGSSRIGAALVYLFRGQRGIRGGPRGHACYFTPRGNEGFVPMKKVVFTALCAVMLCANVGCCRGWFVWPGQYAHNPSFSQCCEKPWHLNPFCKEDGDHLHAQRTRWGRSRKISNQGHGSGHQSGGCQTCGGLDSRGAPAGGYPAMGRQMGHPNRGYARRGYPGAVTASGIPLQPAPNAMSAAQVTYPYYTNRGPRDFFLGYPPGSQPPSIGP